MSSYILSNPMQTEKTYLAELNDLQKNEIANNCCENCKINLLCLALKCLASEKVLKPGSDKIIY